jgi:hypothetical protein
VGKKSDKYAERKRQQKARREAGQARDKAAAARNSRAARRALLADPFFAAALALGARPWPTTTKVEARPTSSPTPPATGPG